VEAGISEQSLADGDYVCSGSAGPVSASGASFELGMAVVPTECASGRISGMQAHGNEPDSTAARRLVSQGTTSDIRSRQIEFRA
jgi:hypothetical protein